MAAASASYSTILFPLLFPLFASSPSLAISSSCSLPSSSSFPNTHSYYNLDLCSLRLHSWAETWHRGTQNKFVRPTFRMTFFRKKIPFNDQKFLITIFLAVDCIL